MLDIIKLVLNALLDIILYLLKGLFNVLAWLLARVWDVAWLVFREFVEIWTNMLLYHPGVSAIVILVGLVALGLWFLWNKFLSQKPVVLWKPAIVIGVLTPIVGAAIGLFLPMHKESKSTPAVAPSAAPTTGQAQPQKKQGRPNGGLQSNPRSAQGR